MKKMSRREFIAKGAGLLAVLGIGGPLLFPDARSKILGTESAKAGMAEEPVLVVIQMSGGNDGINTVVPYGVGAYFDARPTLQIAEKDVLPLNGEVGLHPSLKGLHGLYGQGKLAVIQGVGYPNPNRSHFRSMEIWQTAEPESYIHSGWLGRYGESSFGKGRNPLALLQIGGGANKAFLSETLNVPVIQSLDTFNFMDPKTPKQEQNRIAKTFLEMYDPESQATRLQVACRYGKDAYDSVQAIHSLSGQYVNKIEYPNSGLGLDLQVVAKLLAGGSRTRVFYTQFGGFDDHANEKEQHARVLSTLDTSLTAFYRDIEAQGLQDRVVTVAFSEFGRRVKENGSGGTDHGTAGPMLVLGGRVKGGLYGAYPSLTNLDRGDLKYEVDFRSVYYTLLESWLKGDAKDVLGKAYEKLSFV